MFIRYRGGNIAFYGSIRQIFHNSKKKKKVEEEKEKKENSGRYSTHKRRSMLKGRIEGRIEKRRQKRAIKHFSVYGRLLQIRKQCLSLE